MTKDQNSRHHWAVCEVQAPNPFGRRRRYTLKLLSTHKTKNAAVQRLRPGEGVFFTRHLPPQLRWNKPLRMIEP